MAHTHTPSSKLPPDATAVRRVIEHNGHVHESRVLHHDRDNVYALHSKTGQHIPVPKAELMPEEVALLNKAEEQAKRRGVPCRQVYREMMLLLDELGGPLYFGDPDPAPAGPSQAS